MKIIPAVLPQRYKEIEEAVARIGASVKTIQIDFVDGVFAPNKTWFFNGKDTEVIESFEREDQGLPQWQEINYEFDLMVRDPLNHIEKIMFLGPSKIIFHMESFEKEHMLSYFEQLPEIVRSTVSFGIAVGIGTPPEDVAPFIPFIKTIQCMGIAQVGYQGQTFDVRALAQIRRVKELYPNIQISVDGGVNRASIPLIVEAGADVLVAGSVVFQSSDPQGTMRELKQLCKDLEAQEN